MSDIYDAVLAETGDPELAQRIAGMVGADDIPAAGITDMELTIANHVRSLTTMYAKYGRRVVEEIGAASDHGVIMNVTTATGRYVYTLTLTITP
jgi:hypothetical protein